MFFDFIFVSHQQNHGQQSTEKLSLRESSACTLLNTASEGPEGLTKPSVARLLYCILQYQLSSCDHNYSTHRTSSPTYVHYFEVVSPSPAKISLTLQASAEMIPLSDAPILPSPSVTLASLDATGALLTAQSIPPNLPFATVSAHIRLAATSASIATAFVGATAAHTTHAIHLHPQTTILSSPTAALIATPLSHPVPQRLAPILPALVSFADLLLPFTPSPRLPTFWASLINRATPSPPWAALASAVPALLSALCALPPPPPTMLPISTQTATATLRSTLAREFANVDNTLSDENSDLQVNLAVQRLSDYSTFAPEAQDVSCAAALVWHARHLLLMSPARKRQLAFLDMRDPGVMRLVLQRPAWMLVAQVTPVNRATEYRSTASPHVREAAFALLRACQQEQHISMEQ